MYDIIIVGAGTAGLTAAIYGVRAGKSVLVLEAKTYGGQIINTPKIENYPGIKEISGFEYAKNLYEQAKDLGAEIRFEQVTAIETAESRKLVKTTKDSYECRSVILATGAKNRPLSLPREQELIGAGVSYCATCDGAFFRGRTVAVVGGGDVALEDAIYLARTCEKVYLIHRRDSLRGAMVLQEELKSLPSVEILYDHVVTEICGEDMVEKLRIKNVKTEEEKDLEAAGIFIAVGIHPNTDLLQSLVTVGEDGYIPAGETGETDTPGIYVAGDIRKKPLRQVVTAVADGANAAVSAGNYCNRFRKQS